MEYFWGSVKIMLIVGGLATFIAMLVAGVIKLLFAVIRGRKTPAAATLEVATRPATGSADGTPGKAG